MVTVNELEHAPIVDIAETNIPDCLVKYNKIGKGSGEAKLYAGGTYIRDWDAFFNSFQATFVFTKKDLLQYLEMARFEYETKSQGYRIDITPSWQVYHNTVLSLPDIIPFNLYHKPYKNSARYYVQSDDGIYDLFRQITLPIITRLLIQKVICKDITYIWFRPYITDLGNYLWDDITEQQEQRIENDSTIASTERVALVMSRIGQGQFRDKVLAKYKACIITGVDDKRLLVASHIKPWSVSSNMERLSSENGILLTPTFDKLFDRGFISFKNNSELMVSDYISEKNIVLLKIQRGIKYTRLAFSLELKRNMEYHRDMIFRK